MARIPGRAFPNGGVGSFNPASSTRSVGVPQVIRRGLAQTRHHFGDRRINRLQQDVAEAVQAAKALPFGDGQEQSALVFVANTPLQIAHGLVRAWAGFLVLTMRGPAHIFLSPTQLGDPTQFITVTADANVTADLWIY